MQRLFFAIKLPDDVRAAVSDAQNQIKSQLRHSEVAWIAPQNFHITLHFLGDVDSEERDKLIDLIYTKEFPAPFETSLQQISAFPNKKDPRTIYIDAAPHPSIIGLRKRIADCLVALGFEIDTRKWTPHITVGRVKNRSEILQPEKINLDTLSFKIDSFELMASTLAPQGSIYEQVAEFQLEKI